MSKTLCAVIEKWLGEQDFPILRTDPLPTHEGQFWCVVLTEHLYLLIKDTKVEPIQIVPKDGDAAKVVGVASLESSDPRFFSHLGRALKKVLATEQRAG